MKFWFYTTTVFIQKVKFGSRLIYKIEKMPRSLLHSNNGHQLSVGAWNGGYCTNYFRCNFALVWTTFGTSIVWSKKKLYYCLVQFTYPLYYKIFSRSKVSEKGTSVIRVEPEKWSCYKAAQSITRVIFFTQISI